MPELTSNIFISYSHENALAAKKLSEALRKRRQTVWLDHEDIDFGDDIAERIQAAMDEAELFVVLVSPSTLHSTSTALELGYAIGRTQNSNARLLPITTGNVRLPNILSQYTHFKFEDMSVGEIADKIATRKFSERNLDESSLGRDTDFRRDSSPRKTTIFLIRTSGETKEFYFRIAKFDHVQLTNTAIAVETSLDQNGLLEALGESVVGIEALFPGGSLGYRSELQNLGEVQHNWLARRGL